jgi:excinuclease UvrABC nuclease subunit
MSSKRSDGKYRVFYVGQATDLRARLLQHLGDNEENECIRSERAENCVFRFTYVDSQRERDSIESQTIQEYNPKCNTKKP